MQTYFIQGLFFEENLGIGLRTEPGEGMVAVIRSGMESQMFAGALWDDPTNALGGWVGQTQDKYGGADITKVFIGPEHLEFMKQYQRSGGLPISYRFRKQGQIWVGEYKNARMEGKAVCILTEVPETIFLLPEL
jgi:hypothetical protein